MPDPMYRRIADDLRRKIESGELGHGSRLPTEIELMESYTASRNTVRDAVRWLATRSLVETRPGQGTFVAGTVEPFVTMLSSEMIRTGLGGDYIGVSGDNPAETATDRRHPADTVPRIEIQQASELVAAELELGEDLTVVSRHQQRRIGGTPYSLQTTFYPMGLVQRGAVRLIQAEDLIPGAVTYLQQTLGIKQVGWRDKITVRPSDATETAFFHLPEDGRIAVFETIRTAYDDSGKPLRVTITTYPADRNQFVLIAGEVPEEVRAGVQATANPHEGQRPASGRPADGRGHA
jgi:GntR family transcriptional regulator